MFKAGKNIFKWAECEEQNLIKGIKLSYEFAFYHLMCLTFLTP